MENSKNEELRELAERIEKSLLKHWINDDWPEEWKEREIIPIRKFAQDVATRIVRQRRRQAAEERFRQALGIRLIHKK